MRLPSPALLWSASIALLALTVLVYLPGLHGDFLFDDYANLPALGATGPVDNWATFWRYLTSGTADPTGRPLTLLSFLLDARDWPAEPYPFKRTSLILHLCNGVLLYALLCRLGRLLALAAPRYRAAALLAAALWLLHPLWISTTLYIVQREAMLPATCVLAGLLVWLHGRSRLAAGALTAGFIWSVIGLGGFTVLGVLAKANGALLPLYALLIEVLLARRQPLPLDASRLYRPIMLILGWLPAITVCLYVTWVGLQGTIQGGPPGRPWTYAQRLLTEPRVLLDYLSLLWLPRSSSTGLFNDQYLASSSLFAPITTLPAMFAVFALLAGAWYSRRRHPAFSLAVLFYFAGHLLESTSLPLELYFEHRNYIPALLMFWPLSLWLVDPTRLKGIKRALIVAIPLFLALMTHARASVWGDVTLQAKVWAQINPSSPRAQANAAQVEMQTGHPDEAVRRLEQLLASRPDEVQLALNLIGARCAMGGISRTDAVTAEKAMRLTPNTGTLLAHWFDRTLPVASAGSCPGLDLAMMQGLVNAGLQNPALGRDGPRQDLVYVRGRIALAQRQPDAALADFVEALDERVHPGFALQAAATLGAAGYPTQGLRVLDHYARVEHKTGTPATGMPTVHEWVLARQNYWPHELTRLRHQLSLDAASASINTVDLRSEQVIAR